VIASERATDILDRNDPSTAFLFADGAGAVIGGPADTQGIGPVV
jgi:3-oxoacyl-[acyl-carrier-protein] synthase-3